MRISQVFASSQEQCLIHIFFDSDPKGVSVAVAIPSVSGVWFLDLANMSELQRVNQEITFLQQSSIDHSLAQKCENIGTELVRYYQRMNQHRIAIMQEYAVARSLGTLWAQKWKIDKSTKYGFRIET